MTFDGNVSLEFENRVAKKVQKIVEDSQEFLLRILFLLLEQVSHESFAGINWSILRTFPSCFLQSPREVQINLNFVGSKFLDELGRIPHGINLNPNFNLTRRQIVSLILYIKESLQKQVQRYLKHENFM